MKWIGNSRPGLIAIGAVMVILIMVGAPLLRGILAEAQARAERSSCAEFLGTSVFEGFYDHLLPDPAVPIRRKIVVMDLSLDTAITPAITEASRYFLASGGDMGGTTVLVQACFSTYPDLVEASAARHAEINKMGSGVDEIRRVEADHEPEKPTRLRTHPRVRRV